LAKARQRRVALDQDRAARDSRVESAAADVYVLIEDRSAAEQAVQAANVAISAVLRRLIEQESLILDGVAQLCELELAQVRRLTRTPTASTPPAPAESSPVAPQASEATVTDLRPTGVADAEPSPPESPRARDDATRRAQ
jgi:hypothetical protein